MNYKDCFECGGKCCKFFGVPEIYRDTLHTTGVPLSAYVSIHERNPRKYFELHKGIKIVDNNFIVDKQLKIEVFDIPHLRHLGKQIIIYSECKKLTEDGKCSMYDSRPEMCRNFTTHTAKDYEVQLGCIYDPGNLGIDFFS